MARILIAEDDFAVRDFTYRALSMDHHDVVVAHEGQEALRCLTVPNDTYDLMISDIRMPVIDGVTLSKLVFKQQPQLPILLMTGYSTAEEADYAPSVVGVLQKPFTLDMIRLAVQSALGQARQKPLDRQLKLGLK
ncbi:response regulator [Hyphomicrobiales bacterium 4NK60-0047b]|jgi:DNA-binding NtrC family response regulator